MTDRPEVRARADLVLRNVVLPSALCRGLAGTDLGDGLMRMDLAISDGRIALPGPARQSRDLGGRIALPGLIDAHVHLDKTLTVQRTGFARSGLAEAVGLAMADAPNRTAADLTARMDRAIDMAWRQGTVALRTHLDSMTAPDDSPAWQALARMQARWQGRMVLEPVALMRIDRALEPGFATRCAQIAARGGLAGGYIPAEGCDPAAVDAFLTHAGRAGVAVDFHVDECLDPNAQGIATVLDAMARTGFDRPVTLGHCCALSAMDRPRALALAERMARAGVRVIALPLTNAFLMDRAPGTSPRLRGMTMVQELAALGVPVGFASDNVRDAFYPYGAYDLWEVFRQAVLTLQLEAAPQDWLPAIAARAGQVMGLEAGIIAPGAPADLIVFDARDWTDLMSRAHENRLVLRAGHPLDGAPAWT